MTTSTNLDGAPSDNRETYIGNLILPLVILALGGVCYAQTFDFPTGEDVGPAVIPYLWIGFASLFSLSLIVQAVLRKGKPDPAPGKIGFVVLFIGWIVAYLVAIEPVGYFVSTFVFLIGSMYALTYRNHGVIFSVATGWLIFSYFVFAKFLYIPLPIGPLLQPLLR